MKMTIEYFGLTFTVEYDYDGDKALPVTITDVRTDDNLVELLFCTDNGSRLKAMENDVMRNLVK